MDWSDLLSWVVPNPQECRAEADKLRAAHPGLSSVQLANKAIGSAKKRAAGAGGAAGIFSNPATMVPATLLEAPTVLRVEGKMAGVVAALLDPASLDDYDAFSGDVVSIVFPGAVSQTLREFGVRAGQVVTKDLIRKYISKDVLKTIIKLAAKYLGIKLTQKAIISKTVPVAGAAIGSTWNWIEVQRVGKRALRYHQREAQGDENSEGDNDPAV